MKIGIVTIPERLEYSESLKMATGATLYVDMVKDLSYNHYQAWGDLYESQEEYVLLLQDDIRLKSNFLSRVEEVIKDMQHNCYQFVSLYSNRKEDSDQLANGNAYYKAKQWLNEQAVIVHRDILPGYSQFFEKNREKYKHWHDLLWRDYCKEKGIDIWIKIPNLVDHRLDIKSSVGHPSAPGGIKRQSRTFEYD